MNRYSRDEILKVVVNTLATINPTLAAASADTPLLGGTAVVDSVGFVTLLVTLEQNLGDGELVSSFMEQGSGAEHDHPFGTVASLSDHIHRRLTAGSTR
jgi:hypothetical protein